MASGILTGTAGGAASRVEHKFRSGLWIASALAALALAATAVTAFHAVNEFAPPESVVAAQSSMLAHDGTLYYDLNHYPYTVCAYMPVFYVLEAALIRVGFVPAQGGRLISLAAWCGIVFLCFQIVMVYTGDRTAAWVASILAASSSLLLFWGSTGQVDTLAVFFALTAFYQFSRGQLLWAAVLAGLALFTKQTMVAAPAAICLALFLRDRKRAVLFAAGLGGALAAAILAVNAATHGRFIANTVLANMNPFAWHKLGDQVRFFGSVSGALALVTTAGFSKLRRGPGVAICIYLASVTLVFFATAPKIGSDTNYQIELTAALAIAASIALHRLDFFPLLFQGSKSWVTLLLLPLAVHAAIGYRATVNVVLLRWAVESEWRELETKLRPYVPARGGLVLSGDYNSMVQLRQRLDIEPLIYNLLVTAHAVDPEPVRRDLERGAFSVVLWSRDISEEKAEENLEIGTLPEAQFDAIRRHYRMEAHFDGPFAGGVYVYLPRKDAQ
jgi:hypothetical protein